MEKRKKRWFQVEKVLRRLSAEAGGAVGEMDIMEDKQVNHDIFVLAQAR